MDVVVITGKEEVTSVPSYLVEVNRWNEQCRAGEAYVGPKQCTACPGGTYQDLELHREIVCKNVSTVPCPEGTVTVPATATSNRECHHTTLVFANLNHRPIGFSNGIDFDLPRYRLRVGDRPAMSYTLTTQAKYGFARRFFFGGALAWAVSQSPTDEFALTARSESVGSSGWGLGDKSASGRPTIVTAKLKANSTVVHSTVNVRGFNSSGSVTPGSIASNCLDRSDGFCWLPMTGSRDDAVTLQQLALPAAAGRYVVYVTHRLLYKDLRNTTLHVFLDCDGCGAGSADSHPRHSNSRLVLGHAGYEEGFDHGIWSSQAAFVLEKASGPETVAVRYYGARADSNQTVARMISTDDGPSTAFAWLCTGYCSLDSDASLLNDHTTSINLPPGSAGKSFLAIFTYYFEETFILWSRTGPHVFMT